jgi:hypothetical protein
MKVEVHAMQQRLEETWSVAQLVEGSWGRRGALSLKLLLQKTYFPTIDQSTRQCIL